LVRGERGVAEAAEQSHHRQIELAVSAMRRRIDQPASTVAIDDAVAGPQVAVQSRRRLLGTADGCEISADAFDVGKHAFFHGVGVSRHPYQRSQATVGVELGPRVGWIVRQRSAARRPAVLAPEARGSCSVHVRECVTECVLVGRSAAILVNPLQHEQGRRSPGIGP
jgi:hypothetical protein